MKFEKNNPIIFILCGKARSGKDTSSDFVREYYEEKDEKVFNLQYAHHIKQYVKGITDWDGTEKTKEPYRQLMNYLGTEIVRDNLGKKFFLNRTLEDLFVYSHFYKIITISDARFEWEIEAVREKYKNVVAIHIVRPNMDNNLTEEGKKHRVETGLDGYDNYDYKITNDGSLEELKEKIINIVEEVDNNEY
jgi:hypothetical protein